MPVNTTPIPPIIPGQTSVSEAVSSANLTIERVNNLSSLANEIEVNIGRKEDLITSNKTSIVDAINEMVDIFRNGFLVEEITGNLTNLNTTNRSNIVSAVNEVRSDLGDISVLTTSNKADVVAAINEVNDSTGRIGNLSELVTQMKTSLVDSINEVSQALGSITNLDTNESDVISSINSIFSRMGDVTSLFTSNRNSLVGAINEMYMERDMFLMRDGSNRPTANIDFNQKQIKNLSAGTDVNDAVVVGQVQELAKSGDLQNLNTLSKADLVGSINEVVSMIGDLNNLTTPVNSSLVNAINSVLFESDFAIKQNKLEDVSSAFFGKNITGNHAQTLDWGAKTFTSGYDFRMSRLAGANGDFQFLQSGTGMIYFGYAGSNRVRIRNDADNPLQLNKSGSWTNVAVVGELLEKAGGTMTGPIEFNLPGSSATLVMELGNGFDVYSDNVGDSGASARLWFDKTGTAGEMIFGPRNIADHLKNATFRTEVLTIDGGRLVSTGDIEGLSDVRVKSDIVSIENALEKVCQMEGRHYVKDGVFSTGVIAQEMEKVAPELVSDNDNGLKSVKYMNTIAYLIEAIKELKAEIEELKQTR